MDIIGKRRVYLAISAILVILGLIVLGVVGLNLGVDFTGGSLVRLRFDRAVSAQEVRSALTTGDLAEMDLSRLLYNLFVVSDVQIRAQVGGKPLSVEQVSKVVDVLSQRFGSVSVVESQMVEAVIGKELLNKALVAIILSCVGIVAYLIQIRV